MNYLGFPMKAATPAEIARASVKAKQVRVIGDWVFYYMPDGTIFIDSRKDQDR